MCAYVGGRIRMLRCALMDVSDSIEGLSLGDAAENDLRSLLESIGRVESQIAAFVVRIASRAEELATEGDGPSARELLLGDGRRVSGRRRASGTVPHRTFVTGSMTSQAHHIYKWERGGPPDLHNLVPLCPEHHHRVHERQWSIQLEPDRSLDIRRPDGSRYTTTNPPRRHEVTALESRRFTSARPLRSTA